MPTDAVDSALDSAQVFANSANVVRVFEALDDGSTTSRDLADRSGAARSTVGRILDRGESRGWIHSEGSQYELTYLGRVMIEEFRDYLRTVEGVQHLGEDVQYLPEPAHDLEYCHLRDATITKPRAENPTAPFDRMIELFRAADYHRALIKTGIPRSTRVGWELWSQGQLEGEIVLEASFLQTLRDDPERAEPWVDAARAGTVWIHEDVPEGIQILDEVVLLWLGERREDELYVAGVLESENPAVLSWAESLFEDYRGEAEPLTPEMLHER